MQAMRFDGPIWIQAKKEHDIIYNWPLTTFEELATNCILHNQYDNYQYIGIYISIKIE